MALTRAILLKRAKILAQRANDCAVRANTEKIAQDRVKWSVSEAMRRAEAQLLMELAEEIDAN